MLPGLFAELRETLLRGAFADSAEYEAGLILSFLSGIPRLALRLPGAETDRALSDKNLIARARTLARKRARGDALQYLLGETQFMQLTFLVDKNVLIPRFDTEPMCAYLIELYRKSGFVRVADICCGSGAIGITLAVSLAAAEVIGTDISADALEAAKKNALRHKVERRTHFYQGDLFDALEGQKPFDLMVINPPYIPTAELKTLPPDVRGEPWLALDGGETGLDFYVRIAQGAARWLKKDGLLALELGDGQRDAVCGLLSAAGFGHIEAGYDLTGRIRSLYARLSQEGESD